ncbi:NAD(P)-binding protein [Aeromicrobium sp. UC242_57]
MIIGGGQGGIALGARMRQLGVPTVVIDRHDRPGDQWRSRYKSLCLHDPVWYDHLPYLPFPRELAGVRTEGQDRRLAGDVHQGHGGAVLVAIDRAGCDVRRGGRRLVRHGRP